MAKEKKGEAVKISRRERFLTVGARRTNEVIKRMVLLQRCGNRIGYEYTEAEVEQLMTTLENCMMGLRTAFTKNDKLQPEKFEFLAEGTNVDEA